MLAAIVLDCRHAAPQARFWAAALGWQIRPYDDAEIARLAGLGRTPETDASVAVDSPDGSVTFWCTEVPEPKSVKNRMHLDLRASDPGALIELGARVVAEQDGWTTYLDPEGNEFDVLRG